MALLPVHQKELVWRMRLFPTKEKSCLENFNQAKKANIIVNIRYELIPLSDVDIPVCGPLLRPDGFDGSFLGLTNLGSRSGSTGARIH